ncbi:MAG: DUF4105 domain-containing protein [Leptospiraceae bacterium]|nr:DUF4105 domain-containing protein [Leptospiraceae bacterium]
MKLILLLLFIALLFPINSTEREYLEELIYLSKQKKLSSTKRWKLLIHYQDNLVSGYTSDVVNDEFFRAKTGRTNPEEELVATLESLYKEIKIADRTGQGKCFYPARYKYLKQELQIDESKFSSGDCPDLNEWLASLKPNGLSAVFSSYYMGNPSSMFGHNLYKIHSYGNEENEILDYGVNYAANNTDNNPILYVVKGLTGGYPGNFSLFPYYLKTNEYNDIELRDMWEYKLNLTKDQLDWYISHLWELRLANFKYFFFTKNCAYLLLPALEVANPEWEMESKTSKWIVPPPDSVRIYLETKGLVLSRKNRPSIYSKIMQKLHVMNKEERKEFFSIISNNENYTEIKSQFLKPIFLDAILDYYQMRQVSKKSTEKERNVYKRYLALRSKIDEEYEIKNPIEWSSPPDYSHGPSRVGLAFGSGTLGGFVEAKYRLAYHDVLNRDIGHAPNSEVSFLNFVFRKYENQTNPVLESMNLLKLTSLSPFNDITRTKSYIVDLGIDSVMVKKNLQTENNYLLLAPLAQTPIEQYAFYNYSRELREREKPMKVHPLNFDLAGGLTLQNEFDPFWKKFTVSFLGGVKAQSNREFNGGVRYAPSGIVQLLANFNNLKFQFFVGYYHYMISGNPNDFSVNLRIRYAFDSKHEVRLENNNQSLYSEYLFSYNYLF